jgi:uncharacterized protein
VKTDVQLRYSVTDFDIRSADGGGNTLVGHAAVFNTETTIMGMFREQIAPRAFRKAIKEGDVRALFNHDPSVVLGRNKSGTLRLKEDDVGLWYEVDLPDTQAARDLWTSIDRGDINQSSFAFSVVKELRTEPDEDAGESLPLFTIKEARLYDVSPVTFPAYEEADVAARVMQRAASLSGQSINEIRDAIDAGECARIWTPATTTPEQREEQPAEGEHSEGTREPEPRSNPFPLYL